MDNQVVNRNIIFNQVLCFNRQQGFTRQNFYSLYGNIAASYLATFSMLFNKNPVDTAFIWVPKGVKKYIHVYNKTTKMLKNCGANAF